MPLGPRGWEIQQGETFRQDAENAFCLKYLSITPKEFRFLYALKFSQRGIPHVRAISYSSSNIEALSSTQTNLPTTVQSLGYFTEFNIGVIHVSRLDLPYHSIILHVTPPGEITSTWQLVPIRLFEDDPHKYTSKVGIITDRMELPEVEFYGPVEKEQVAFFKSNIPEQRGADIFPIFFRMDDPIMVYPITETEYFSFTGYSKLPQ